NEFGWRTARLLRIRVPRFRVSAPGRGADRGTGASRRRIVAWAPKPNSTRRARKLERSGRPPGRPEGRPAPIAGLRSAQLFDVLGQQTAEARKAGIFVEIDPQISKRSRHVLNVNGIATCNRLISERAKRLEVALHGHQIESASEFRYGRVVSQTAA